MNYLGLNAASWVKVAELGIVGVAFKGECIVPLENPGLGNRLRGWLWGGGSLGGLSRKNRG